MRRAGRFVIALAAALVALATAPVAPGSIGGTLPAPGVVWVSDRKKHDRVNGAVITQHDRTFVPALTVVTAGSEVRFRNDDDVDHSVYSISPPGPFDLGIYEAGPGKTVAFPNAGVIDVHCHIHRHMRATLLVVDGPYVRLEAAGAWTIGGLAPGKYNVHEWTLERGETTRSAEVR